MIRLLIIGLDMGGTTTKGVLASESGILAKTVVVASDPLAAAAGAIGKLLTDKGVKLDDVEAVALSGGRTKPLPDRILGLPVREVDEIEAVGRGGAYLAGMKECVVVSAGTGTAVVEVRIDGARCRVRHLGGTAVGAGTLLGLGRLLLRRTSIASLMEMARRGNPKNVDLTVGDIVGGPVGRLDPDVTASNFGKVGDDVKPEDIAAGLVNMVGQVIGTVGLFAAKSVGLEERVVLVGGLMTHELLVKAAMKPFNLFGGSAIVPKDPQFATAIGASLKVLATYTSPLGERHEA